MGDLETVREGGVLEVTLSRAARKNAVTLEMWEGLARLFVEADMDPDVRVVVIRGAGGHFCAGADLTNAAPGAESDGGAATRPGSLEARTLAMMRRRIAPTAIALHRLGKPSIALVEGVAAGAGANLALGCDLTYAAADARFSQIFVRRGLSIDFGGSWLLPRLVGTQKAKELALFGDFIPATEAAAIGLTAGALPGDQLEAHVRERAERLAAQAPLPMANIKGLLDAGFDRSFAEAVDAEFVAQARCTVSDDFAEGLAAFKEKRSPRFEGR